MNQPQGERSTFAARRIIGLLVLIAPLDQVAFDLYTPALPEIGEQFAASNVVVQNTVTAYMLGMTLIVLPAGLIADAIGRKRVLVTGLAVMTLTSIGCALTVSLEMMIGLRFVQGLGAGTCMVLAAAMAADCFRGAKLVSVLGLLGAAWGAAPILAPAIGGFITDFASWRTVFVVLAGFLAIVGTLVAVALPETLEHGRRSPIDLRAAAGVVGQAMRNRSFVTFATMFGVVTSAQAMFAVVGPFLYVIGLGFTSSTYGLIALGVGTANFLGAAACGALAQRTTTARLAIAGSVILAVGGAIMLVSAELVGLSAVAIAGGAVIAALAIGVLDPLSKGLAMGVFTRNLGLVSGMVSAFCYVWITLSAALMAWLPERSQAPLGWFYVGAAAGMVVLLMTSFGRFRPAGGPDLQDRDQMVEEEAGDEFAS
ncbi:Bcr/CflA family drug resistance efflux transporter [Mycolicibacterium moriokaense]|uniref:MFS transporter n=1 Tax=Mycolicibacterium moriokaense TaxID=39691 RepID=A0AAD1M4S8_9MYCO|nr:multidrug effflux MFS transporter [Mycolicibacterium moriokaense]MCV7037964.1 multidrug effflux MFS transporter [Mycolicibacterium moriokaense]ORB19604.1 Bcr/CflA family drug resistance efflux transporter [Mycolicibacterium moriokaense]BBW99594.1 MFS transporter [Mycolicibacterium moriokaense]